jgi:copper(I)-binding protein
VRSRLVSAALLSSALLLSGCGTGLQATTYTKELSPRDFDPASVGDLQIRNLGIAPPSSGDTHTAGQTAVLTGAVVNRGTKDDALVAVESSVAGATSLWLNGKTVSEVPVAAGGDAGTWTALLTGLREDLRIGDYVDVTLVFTHAGRLEGAKVPVRIGDTGLGDRDAEQDPYKSAE